MLIIFWRTSNTELIILIAPNKANYYSAHIPTYLQRDKKISNYDYYVKKLDELNFNVLDVNNWFLKMGTKNEYPLFTKTGTHWSHYAASLVADSLIGYIERKINREMYHFEIDSLDFSFTRKANTDYDIGDLMNTLFAVDDNSYGFPSSFKSIPNSDNYKPSMIVIADSFVWTIYRDYFSSCFYDVEYWYYFNPSIHGNMINQ